MMVVMIMAGGKRRRPTNSGQKGNEGILGGERERERDNGNKKEKEKRKREQKGSFG